MQKQLLVADRKISYTLKRHAKAKRVTLAVHHDGSIVMTIPRYWSLRAADQFIRQKASWLIRTIQKYASIPHASNVIGSRRHYFIYRAKAKELATQRVAVFSQRYGVSAPKISIRNQQTRWGSCSKKGTLSFSYKILFLPSHLCDYVIVHELCHLLEFSHSQKFWDLVAKTIPRYTMVKKELRQFSSVKGPLANY